MYIYIKNNIATEFIPEEDENFPGIPIEARYAAEFVTSLIHVETGQRSSRIGFMTLKRRPSPHPLSRSRNQNLK